MNKMQYYEMDLFKGIYLEDSFVLDIQEEGNCLKFVLDAVLTPEHPDYRLPDENEQYCYKKVSIIFRNVSSVKWISRENTYFTDATGEKDYGNIDFFEKNDDLYKLGGDWGEVELSSSSIELQ